MVGTSATAVNEMGKTLTPDGVMMPDGGLPHADIMDMPVSQSVQSVYMYIYKKVICR